VLDVDLGFQPERAAALRIDPNATYKTQEQKNAYFTEALRGVLDVPGIEAAGLSDALPLGRNRNWGIAAKGMIYTPQTYPYGFPRIISEGYFRAMGIPLRTGRDFTERDTKGSLPVIILNETLARNLWPGQDPIGRIVRTDNPERTVLGVVGDVRHLALEEASGNEFYIPMRQTDDYGTVDLVVRTSLPTAQLASRLREGLRPVESNLPTSDLRTLQTLVDRATSPRRFVALLLGGFAGFALILASAGNLCSDLVFGESAPHRDWDSDGIGRVADGGEATYLGRDYAFGGNGRGDWTDWSAADNAAGDFAFVWRDHDRPFDVRGDDCDPCSHGRAGRVFARTASGSD